MAMLARIKEYFKDRGGFEVSSAYAATWMASLSRKAIIVSVPENVS